MKGGEVKVDKIEELLEYNKKILQELADLKKRNKQLEEKVRQLTLEKPLSRKTIKPYAKKFMADLVKRVLMLIM